MATIGLLALRMRDLLLFSALAILAGCSSGRVRPEELAYAREAQSQSLIAYQICSEESTGDLKKCDALVSLQDADRKRLELLTAIK
jgi:hypothetical protein